MDAGMGVCQLVNVRFCSNQLCCCECVHSHSVACVCLSSCYIIHSLVLRIYILRNFHKYIIFVGGICSQLVDPSNGHVDTSAGTSYGDVARYSCDRGYTLNGPAQRTCQPNRQWSGSAPTCESEWTTCHSISITLPLDEYTVHASTLTLAVIDCGPLESITNGNIVLIDGGTTFNSIAMYKCNSGYHPVGMANRVCQSSGQWSGSTPRCDRNCEYLLIAFIYLYHTTTVRM